MRHALTLLQIFAITQFGCGGREFQKNVLKRTTKGNHWGYWTFLFGEIYYLYQLPYHNWLYKQGMVFVFCFHRYLLLFFLALFLYYHRDLRARLEVAIARVAELGQRVAEQSNFASRYAVSASTAPTSPTGKTPPVSPVDRSAPVCTDEVISVFWHFLASWFRCLVVGIKRVAPVNVYCFVMPATRRFAVLKFSVSFRKIRRVHEL